MKVYSFFKDKFIRYSIICIFAIVILSSLYITLFKSNSNNSINNEVKIYNENINSYSAKYNVMIISNKNINTYTINEKFKKINNEECFKFSFNDALENKVSYIVRNDYVKISSDNQLSEYITNVNTIGNFNLLSTKTYLDILNEIYTNNYNNTNSSYYINDITKFEDIKKESINTKITIILDKKRYENFNNENCNIKDLFSLGMNINKIEIILDSKGYFNTIRVYSNNLLYLEIEYEMLCLNEVIEDTKFDM